MGDDEFIEVKYRDRRAPGNNNRGQNGGHRGRGRIQNPSRSYAMHLSEPKIGNIKEEVTKGKERITECLREVQRSSYYSKVQDHLIRCEKKETIKSIVCYGIGSFHGSKKCRYQFALLLAMRDYLEIRPENVYIFDPVLNEVDRNIIIEYGMKIIKENELCKRKANEKTLFYMPHCGKQLYSNLLWANWTLRLLQNVILFGNSFQMLKNEVKKQNKAIYVYRVLPFIHELPLLDTFEPTGVFNDMGIHLVKEKNLKELQDEFWAQHDEEEMDENDPEINNNNTVS